MALKKDEFIALVKNLIADRTDDEAINALESVSDTLDELYSDTNYKALYEENDKAWRERYIARFSGEEVTDPEPLDPAGDPEPAEEITIDDLFEETEED